MYQRLPSWVLGFHGTDAKTVKDILNSSTAHLRPSNNVAEDFKLLNQPLPENEGPTDDLLRRFLDRAVFDHVHTLREERKLAHTKRCALRSLTGNHSTTTRFSG